MVAEAEHEKGQEGALLAKKWLESTTYVNITFTVYDDMAQTTLVRLDGEHKRYDLVGMFLGDDRHPLYVEVKNYNVVGKQPEEYVEFLANAYSTTATFLKDDLDKKIDYMWVTWHPFSQTKWAQLTTPAEVADALKKHPEALNGQEVNDELVRTVASRLWLVMLNRRQDKFHLTRSELFQVHQVLQRKGFMS